MTLDRLLLRCVPYTPDRTAVATPHRRHTYADLARAVAAYSNALSDNGVSPGDRIVAVLDPGIEAVALLTASARLGAIWVPVAAGSTPACIRAIVEAVSPAVLVTSGGVDESVVRGNVAIACPDEDTWRWLTPAGRGQPASSQRGVLDIDAAYIAYGASAGQAARGVVMSHRAAAACLDALLPFNALAIGTVIGSIASIQCDVWLLSTLAALASGGTIACLPRASIAQPREQARHMKALGVNQMNGTPATWSMLLRHAEKELRDVETLLSVLYTRESFPIGDLKQLARLFPDLRIVNCFSHRESLACSFADVPNPLPGDAEALSFGRGHDGVELLLVDNAGRRITTPHVLGELYVRSPALFLGYWNDPVATAQALVLHPLLPQTGERVFRAGDLACFDSNGDYFFAGRAADEAHAAGGRVAHPSVRHAWH